MASASGLIVSQADRAGMDSASVLTASQIDRAGMDSAPAAIARAVFEIGISITTRPASWDAGGEIGIAIGTSVETITGGGTVAGGSTTRG